MRKVRFGLIHSIHNQTKAFVWTVNCFCASLIISFPFISEMLICQGTSDPLRCSIKHQVERTSFCCWCYCWRCCCCCFCFYCFANLTIQDWIKTHSRNTHCCRVRCSFLSSRTACLVVGGKFVWSSCRAITHTLHFVKRQYCEHMKCWQFKQYYKFKRSSNLTVQNIKITRITRRTRVLETCFIFSSHKV